MTEINMTEIKIAPLRILVFQEENWWIAQCLEYDLTAQSKTREGAQENFIKLLIAHTISRVEAKQGIFDGIKPAPQAYHTMFEKANQNRGNRITEKQAIAPISRKEPMGSLVSDCIFAEVAAVQ